MVPAASRIFKISSEICKFDLRPEYTRIQLQNTLLSHHELKPKCIEFKNLPLVYKNFNVIFLIFCCLRHLYLKSLSQTYM